MTSLTPIAPGVHAIETSLRVAPGFYLPLRTTVLGLASGGLAIVSPQATSDEVADAIQELGPVEHVIAPNTFHHLFLEAAKERWPEAQTQGGRRVTCSALLMWVRRGSCYRRPRTGRCSNKRRLRKARRP